MSFARVRVWLRNHPVRKPSRRPFAAAEFARKECGTTPREITVEARRSLVLPVLAAFAASSAAFGASIIVSDYASREIQVFANDITENASPSVYHLMEAHDALWQLQVATEEYYDRVGTDHHVKIAPALSKLHEAWRSYEVLPEFPGEPALKRKILPRLMHADELAQQVLSASSTGTEPASIRTSEHEATESFRDAAVGLMELVRLNQTSGHLAAIQVKEKRNRAQHLALSLGLAALIITAMLAWVVTTAMKALDRVRAEYEQLLESKAREEEIFASRVAHDIKSPIATAMIWCEVAKLPGRNPAHALEKVHASLGRVTQVVNDLYDFARALVPSGGSAITRIPEAVRSVVEDIEPRALQAGLTVSASGVADYTLAVAPGVFTSILSNLLMNAVKYAGVGSQVSVRTMTREDDQVRVEVADTGAGISTEFQATIFQEFKRGSPNQPDGLGLGLATVKRLVERHGGQCGVHSSPGNGSVFWFDLPKVA